MNAQVFSGILLILLLAQGAIRAQEPPPPPPPAPDYFPKRWKDFSSAEGRFRVRFPGHPTESTEIKPGNIVLHGITYGSGKFIFYGVSYRDLPKTVTSEAEARDFLRGVRENRLLGMEDKMKLLSEKDTVRDGQPALQLEIELLPDRRLRELDTIRGNRHYNVMVITFSNHHAMGSENAYGEIANTFLDSFHLIDPILLKSGVN